MRDLKKGENCTFAIKPVKSCIECAASTDSKNDASSGFSISVTCTCWVIRTRDMKKRLTSSLLSLNRILHGSRKQPFWEKIHLDSACRFQLQLERKTNSHCYLDDHCMQQKLMEDWGRLGHPKLPSLHLTIPMQWHIGHLLETYKNIDDIQWLISSIAINILFPLLTALHLFHSQKTVFQFITTQNSLKRLFFPLLHVLISIILINISSNENIP